MRKTLRIFGAQYSLGVMHRVLFLIALCFIRHSSHATESGATPIEEGKSPDGQMEVVSVPGADGSHFEIRTSSGATVFSEESLKEEFGGRASFAETVLWRPDSRFVAIAFGTYKFAVETV